jgi:Transglycosylase-like domain
VRIRIALTTAAAVIALPAIVLAVFTNSSAASARLTRHQAVGRQHGVKISLTLMSYGQAQKVATMATYADAVERSHVEAYLTERADEKNYLTEVAYLRAVAARSQPPATAAAPVHVVTAPAAAATPAVPGAGSDATSTDTADWACIRQHESGDDYTAGNGGAYQFEFGTWSALTGLSSPAEDYPPAVQDAAALELYAERGWEPWTTRYVCGL